MDVSYIILRVSDMTRALDFYRDIVGLRVERQGPTFSFLDAGTIRVALNEIAELDVDTTATEIVLEVDDVRGAYTEMSERGVAFEVELRPVMVTDQGTLVAAHFRDPDGHLWSVTGWEDQPAAAAGG